CPGAGGFCDDPIGHRLVIGGFRIPIVRSARALLGRFVLEDSDRLSEALGQRGQFGRSEDEDDDREDDEGVPAREIVQHGLWPFEWLVCGFGMFSDDVQSPTRHRWTPSTAPRTRRAGPTLRTAPALRRFSAFSAS